MPHRGDGQIWRTAERPAGSCCLLCQASAERFRALVAVGSGPVELQRVRRLSADSQSATLVRTYGEQCGSRTPRQAVAQPRQTRISTSHRSLHGCNPTTCCCLRDYVNYDAARLPECLRCVLVVRSICHFAHYALPSSISSPCSFPCGVVDSARRIGELRTPLAANDGCRSGGH
jgi:hypothetical protein